MDYILNYSTPLVDTTEGNEVSTGQETSETPLFNATVNNMLTTVRETVSDKVNVISSSPVYSTTVANYVEEITTQFTDIQNVNITRFHSELQTNSTVAITTIKSFHPDMHIHAGKENNDADIQALVYVFAVVVFYGLVLIVALMGMRVRKRRITRLDDGYAALIDRNEVVRRDTVLRQKMNVLRLSNVHNGYLLDQIPEHSVWCLLTVHDEFETWKIFPN